MPSSSSTTARNTARLHLTVTDLRGVQRVLTLLIGPNTCSPASRPTTQGDGRWRVALDVVADPDQVQLLEARLHRNPGVFGVGRP